MLAVLTAPVVCGEYAASRRWPSSHCRCSRVAEIASVALGAVIALAAVWAITDVVMGLMALVNLTAILLLGKWAFAALGDYQQMRRQGQDPAFVAAGDNLRPAPLPGDVW